MKLKSLLSVTVTACLGAALFLTVGCGGEGNGGGGDSSDASNVNVTELEAKAAKGDADAAFKIGEFYAQNLSNAESSVKALTWFYIAQAMGAPNAKLGVTTVEKNIKPDQLMEAKLASDKYLKAMPK